MFDLHDIVFRNRLRMAKFSTFEDKNEGVGHILTMQDNHMFRSNFLAQEAIEKSHLQVRENHYATCWTTEPDKIAMWSLYSSDRLSIRVGTTIGKLIDAIHKANEFNSWAKATGEPGSRKRITWNYTVQAVKYVDYFQLRDKVRSRFSIFNQQAHAKAKKNPDYFKAGGEFYSDYKVFQQESISERDGLFLKDAAYSHEHEVRGILYSGVRNNITLVDWRKNDNPFENLFDWADPDELDDFLHVDVAPDFLDSVCFDPRLPKYKREVFEALFPSLSNKTQESRAFGYVFVQDTFTSDYDGKSI